jgi:mono/diheme cytochrome c family protein
MTRTAAVTPLIAMALLPPALAKAEEKLDAAAAASGRVIYQRYCASCHGRGGRGDGTLAEDLRVRPTDLTQLAAKSGGSFPFAAVVESIDGRRRTRGHGTADMPVWGEVFTKTTGTGTSTVEAAVDRIAHYLWSIQR